ncbi:PREDICTED: pro-interleukin-16-like [Leptosomus discolor]|uniref:pro-interleukin-16-like n=1 Tax=Leptosomus discolor TaxID=188344 RepID=UPI0005227696|nr:PREDICTED: pro-interleukin-16-like [Leptosomus discolor]
MKRNSLLQESGLSALLLILSSREEEKVIESIMPHQWENDRKKSSTTSSLKMDRKSNAGNRKSRKFRSISRSLILCNAKNSDDGSSPDEKCPDPFEISASWSQEDFDCCPRTQLPCTPETEDSPPDPPCVITSMVQSKAAANENCNNMRRKLLTKVGNSVQYIVMFPIMVVPKWINTYFSGTRDST